MDRKTLEWMAERVEKGNRIIEKIDHLKKIKANLQGVKVIELRDDHGNVYGFIRAFGKVGTPEQERLVSELRKSMDELIDAEIDRLEQELAEL